ncbi:DUF6101 family protein [Paenochrobactrum sp. BZR 588]|uniref:DUF6101 family protein n=1 Tax=Paenochrobactrum TaxID=999488 RepID=UPI0035BC930F
MLKQEQHQPVWANRELRLNPFRFPQVVSYANHEREELVTFTLNERGAVIRRVMPSSGTPLSISLPASAFIGVTARAAEDANGHITVTLELMHADPQLSVPLLVAHDLADVADDWRAWASAFDLPMMLMEEDGVARSLDESAYLTADKHTTHKNICRPRFIARHKVSGLGMRLVISGKTVITAR